MTPIITVENLGKKYIIRHSQGGTYKTLRESLAEGVKKVGKNLLQLKRGIYRQTKEEFWALKDISFTIHDGEKVGIIGRNGAGKTTLLKILSQITEPTRGIAVLMGRTASLLEVGTGFHPELTGRENIFLNGSIMGLKRWEIKKKFDDIVAFADVEKFLDTPVKRYSSGMYVRLAFAVAAHLEPEILLVDEVLAVGDVQFQKKCLGKMGEIADQGRTILFVSHNMGILQELVNRGIWLDEGRILYDGDIKTTVSKYLSSGLAFDDLVTDLTSHRNRLAGMKRILKRLSCRAAAGVLTREFSQADEIVLDLEYQAPQSINLIGAGFIISTIEGIRVGGFNTFMSSPPSTNIPKLGKITFSIPADQFTPGTYFVTVSLASHQKKLEDKVENCISFTIHPSDIYGTGYLLTKEDGVAALWAKTSIADLENQL